MKNKSPLILLVAIILIAAVVYVLKTQKFSKKELTDFAIKDTSIVTKIFLANKSGTGSVVLEKQADNEWKVNNKYRVRKDAIENVLSTLASLKVKAPVGRASFNNIIKALASSATKVEVYNKSDLIKTIYVGGPTMEYDGTYMMIEGSSKPYIVEIPGFEGYLSTRFFTDEEQWKDSKIFSVKFKELQKVVMQDIVNPLNSFQIELKPQLNNKEKRDVSLSNFPKTQNTASFDTVQVNSYLQNLLNIHYEFEATTIRESKKDSALKKPLANIFVYSAANTRKVSLFAVPAGGTKQDFAGNNIQYDVDKLYACFDDNYKDFYICQYFVFDKVTLPMETFIKNKKSIVNK
jgi:hypothetical protein